MTRDPGLDFSFSGLKTALVYRVRELGDGGVAARRADLAASFQAAVVGQLVAKLERALDAAATGRRSRSAAGSRRTGRCASGSRRVCERARRRLKLVAPELCTDNAAMIASAARFAEAAPYPDYLAWDAADVSPPTVVTLYTAATAAISATRRATAPRAARRGAGVRASRGRHRDRRRPPRPVSRADPGRSRSSGEIVCELDARPRLACRARDSLGRCAA